MAKTPKNTVEKNESIAPLKRDKEDVFVVGIGASAGGLQALESLFSIVPQDSVAYVIVQHISSEYRSLLKELLAQYSSLKVEEAIHDTPVQRNRVYVIPNDKILTIKGNRLQLLEKTLTGRTKTVDTFFQSLAEDKKQRAIGIILSGTGTDGTEGVKAIKQAGGLVLVQDPASAKFDGMPRSAINAGYADHILAPELMPAEIFNFVKVIPITNKVTELVNAETESSYYLILDMVHDRSGIDFSNYKRPTIIRRISRRMATLNVHTLVDYLDYMNLHPDELDKLSKEFLIGVTTFFRDTEAYQILADTVIPELVNRKKNNDQLRIWIAGCSTGEEAYSIAILISEYLQKTKKVLEVKVFASDIDRSALDFAGKGLYPESSISELSPERQREFFQKEDGKYRICQRVRRMVIFAPHNVITDPPFSRIDLVSCRNMLIYLNQVLQKKVLEKFHYALIVGGFLFLGSSESIGTLSGFGEVNKKWKIFRNTEPAPALGMAESFTNSNISRLPLITHASNIGPNLPNRQVLQHSFNEMLSETILEEYGCAAVYIDEHYDVLHGAGRFKSFLDLPDHNFTFNVLKLVPQDLAVSLGAMLRKATADGEKLTTHNIQVRDGKKLRYINVVVKPFYTEKRQFQKFILVLFSETQPSTPLKENQGLLLHNEQYETRVQELETELQYTKDDLQAVVEELETANEELQSTNEELLSSNEELQSTNEELQSLNEELHTINSEHQYKIKALIELDDDLNNYFRSSDIGQIFVDRNLTIRKYTPAATHIINLIESDIGRSIYQISYNLRYNNLIEDVRHVIATNHMVEKEVQDKSDIWYQMRILPYITQERKIDGAIIIFIQINELKTLQLLHAGIMHSSPNAIIALKAVRNEKHSLIDFRLTLINYKAQMLFDRTTGTLSGKTLWKEYPHLLENGTFEQLVHVVETGEQLDIDKLLVIKKKERWLHMVAVKFDDGLVLTLQDITDRKLNEQSLLAQQEEIRASAERFRILLEAVPHMTWTNLPNGESNTYNDYWYDYTGLSKEESAGWGWEKAFHPDDLKAILPTYKRSLKKGVVFNTQARILRRADKMYRWHMIKNVPIRNEAGEITLWVGTATDIQDQKDAESTNIRLRLVQQRELLNIVLTAQEEERSRISEALHNGLGQILYAAKLNIDNLVIEDKEQEKIKESINQFLMEGIKITRDISFELSPSVLKEFGLKDAVEEVITRYKGPKLKITHSITGFEKEVDYTSALSLYRIIQELLNNIVKHSQATKASIDLKRENNQVHLRVKDNGIGMVTNSATVTKGVGLTGIQNRVALLEGKMKIVTQPGKGFFIDITCKI